MAWPTYIIIIINNQPTVKESCPDSNGLRNLTKNNSLNLFNNNLQIQLFQATIHSRGACPFNLYMIINVDDNLVFLHQKSASRFCRETIHILFILNEAKFTTDVGSPILSRRLLEQIKYSPLTRLTFTILVG